MASVGLPAASPDAVPAGALVGPVPLAALLILVLNDHWWKAGWPGPVTGKLSDVAGLVLAPLVLQAAVEVVEARSGRDWYLSIRLLTACVILVGAIFTAVNVLPLAADAYRWILGAVQWPFSAAWSVLTSGIVPGVRPVAFVLDTTDLVVLPALLIPIAIGWWRVDRSRG